MSASLRMRVGVVAAGLACLMMGYAWAQQETEQPRGVPAEREREEVRQPDAPQLGQPHTAEFRAQTPGAQDQELARYLASCMIHKNEAQIEIYELAQQKAENPEVKQFAQEALQDHRQLVQQLRQVAGPQAAPGQQRQQTQPGQQAQPGQQLGAPGQIDAQRQPGAERLPGAQRQPGAAPGADQGLNQLTQLDRQITERATELLREELEEKEGAEFDQAFLGVQVGSHLHMLAAVEVIGQQGPNQLRQIAQQARSPIQEHLEEAKQLKQRLEERGLATGRAEREPRRQ